MKASLTKKSPAPAASQPKQQAPPKQPVKKVIKQRKENAVSEENQKQDWGELQPKKVPPPDRDPEVKEADLDVEHERILEALNPNAPENIARYSFQEEAFKLEATVEQTAFHYIDDGNVIHKDSEEAKLQREEEERRKLELQRMIEERKREMEDEKGEDEELGGQKQLHNQFNYSERATQTLNYPPKDTFVFTEPPPSMDFSATATQWEIYDSYTNLLAQQKKSGGNKKEAGSKGEAAIVAEEETKTPKPKSLEQVLNLASFKRSTKIMERMINQNKNDEILQDFKFWNDASDEFRELGSLLPLWRFENEKVKKKQVTALCWNSQYHDLFAVGYGSYDFNKQGAGVICCFSLKNPSHPEYTFPTEAGVMCLDFHPKHSSLLAVGLYDGTVLIIDVRQGAPVIQSNVRTGKHTDVVWEVRWQPETVTQSLNFFSVASDGRVTNWTLSKNELQYTDIMMLKIEQQNQDKSESKKIQYSSSFGEEQTTTEEYIDGLAGGTCFDFNKKSEHLFIVGTEEGKIHLCSKAYNSQYLQTYEGHNMSVYSVKWNYYQHNVFLSASADWTVKLWEVNHKNALMTFDLGSAVGDIAWAPYSSTVFAAVTDIGKVCVFDLNVNKHDSLCDQLVVKKAKLTHVTFNHKEPVILVGDDKGIVQTLKLSPNLRKVTKPQENQTQQEAEIAKLNTILDVAIKNISTN